MLWRGVVGGGSATGPARSNHPRLEDIPDVGDALRGALGPLMPHKPKEGCCTAR